MTVELRTALVTLVVAVLAAGVLVAFVVVPSGDSAAGDPAPEEPVDLGPSADVAVVDLTAFDDGTIVLEAEVTNTGTAELELRPEHLSLWEVSGGDQFPRAAGGGELTAETLAPGESTIATTSHVVPLGVFEMVLRVIVDGRLLAESSVDLF